MKLVCAALVSLLAGTVGAQTTNPVTKALSLRECIERALANNLELRVEKLNPRIADWGVVLRQGEFDPVLSGGVSYRDTASPTSGGGESKSHALAPSLALGGRLPTGTGYEFFGDDTRAGGAGITNFLYTGSVGVTLTQPLLRNFWFGPNLAGIRVARRNLSIAEFNFTRLVMTKVSEVGQAYYELVFAIENHKAKLEDLTRAKQLLAENRKRVEIGVMSPLDVTQAEAGVAEREEAVILAERQIADNENTLKRLIAADVAEFAGVTLVPTDLPTMEMVELDVTRSTRQALADRPDFHAVREAVERQDILVRYNRNQLWPQVDLQASYAAAGRAGGFGDLTSDQFNGDYPAWSVGVIVRVPLGNRQARANYNIARLDAEQALIGLKQLEQDIVVEVDNAVGRVRTNLKRLDATRAARRLAVESLKAEEAKLKAGTSTSFLVLQAQSQLAAAQSAEVRARADYAQSLIALARAEGATLRRYQIELEKGR